VYDDDLPDIPKNVLQQSHNKADYLVRFYDKSDLWYAVICDTRACTSPPHSHSFQGMDTQWYAETAW